jgi:hypothetical protein
VLLRVPVFKLKGNKVVQPVSPQFKKGITNGGVVLSGGKVSVEEGVEVLYEKKKMNFYNEELCEMGDDFCTMKLYERVVYK